jgi:hypothetical protein
LSFDNNIRILNKQTNMAHSINIQLLWKVLSNISFLVIA